MRIACVQLISVYDLISRNRNSDIEGKNRRKSPERWQLVIGNWSNFGLFPTPKRKKVKKKLCHYLFCSVPSNLSLISSLVGNQESFRCSPSHIHTVTIFLGFAQSFPRKSRFESSLFLLYKKKNSLFLGV